MAKRGVGFSEALACVKSLGVAERAGWVGEYILLLRPLNNNGAPYEVHPCLALMLSDDSLQPGWVPTQEDLLAEDWSTRDGMLDADSEDSVSLRV